MTGLTVAVANHIASVPSEALSPAAIHASERSLLDAVGVMLGATTLGEGAAPFADLAARSPGPCTVLGRGYRAQPLQAALANGALAHALDYEDALDGAPIHPNAAVIPVAMALSEDEPNITGREMITAIAIGCDLVCRLGLALERNPDEFGWYPPPILSTFGAAATAARLLKLTTDQTAHALALALAQATFSSEFKTSPDSSLRAVRDAFPAHAGLLAATLAQRGVRGHHTALEGKAGLFALFARGAWRPETVTASLGEKFHGEDLSFKPWPSCRGTHAFIEAALLLRRDIPDLSEITTIAASGPPLLTMLVEPTTQKRAPVTAIDAKFSLPFCIAAALSTGAVTLPTFFEAGRHHAETLALAKLVNFNPDPSLGMKDAASGILTIRLRDGRSLTHTVAQARGSPANPLDDEALLQKFGDCADYANPKIQPTGARGIGRSLLRGATIQSASHLFAEFNP
jgi:2-methylcitrate dehydratase PrpD